MKSPGTRPRPCRHPHGREALRAFGDELRPRGDPRRHASRHRRVQRRSADHRPVNLPAIGSHASPLPASRNGSKRLGMRAKHGSRMSGFWHTSATDVPGGSGRSCPIAVMARMRDGSHGIAHRELGGFGHDGRPAILPRGEVVEDDSAHGLIWRLANECAGGVFIIGLHDPFCTHPRLG